MQLTEHFSLAEFVASDIAARRGLDNSLPDELLLAAAATCTMLERVRAALCALAGREIPIEITSGYRCSALNRAVGSSPGSDHPRGFAADWRAPAFGTPHDICKALVPRIVQLGIGQLIHEYGAWVHTSTRCPDKPANRVITISNAGIQLGIQEIAA